MLKPSLIKDHYDDIIVSIMQEGNVPMLPRGARDHIVPADATFQEVAQHTEAFVGRRLNNALDYRYNRYYNSLPKLNPKRKVAHLDIGCGAGLFSWVITDRATSLGFAHDNIMLHGLDHCPAMIGLALTIRDHLIQLLPTYPCLHYEVAPNLLVQSLTARHQPGTDYIITFGHALVQAHGQTNIHTFTQVISHALSLPNDQDATYTLIAVDAHSRDSDLSVAWSDLLLSLGQASVGHAQYGMMSSGVRSISLHPTTR